MGKSGKLNEKKKLEKEPKKGPKAESPLVPDITNPGKEFDIDPAAIPMIQELGRKQIEHVHSMKAFAMLRHDYLTKERELKADWDMAVRQCKEIDDKIKAHHKIIGEVVKFDIKRNKIIIK